MLEGVVCVVVELCCVMLRLQCVSNFYASVSKRQPNNCKYKTIRVGSVLF